MKRHLLILIFVLLCGVSMGQKPQVKSAKQKQADYTLAITKRVNQANAPHEATIKLLKEYHRLKPKETEAAIQTIREAIEHNLDN